MTALVLTLLWGGAAICGALAFLEAAEHAEPDLWRMAGLLSVTTCCAFACASFAEKLLP